MENINNKYYQEKENEIKVLISNNKFEDALEIINEELSMPYIPMKFEEFLINSINLIPLPNRQTTSYSMSLDKIIDLLLKLDKTKNDVRDIINQLSRFNLSNEKEELEYYFNKSTNTRNRATTFELLIKMKVDIECSLGNPSKSTSIMDLPLYKEDLERLRELLGDNYPELIEVSVDLLNEIYLTTHVGQKLEGNFSGLVVYTVGKIFEREELKEIAGDLNLIKEKMESFKSFDNL